MVTFFPLYLFHIWMMIGPLQGWCRGNTIMIMYSVYTFLQLVVSYLYAWQSPYWLTFPTAIRWIPAALGLATGGMWIASCIILIIKVMMNGDIWKEFEDVV